MTVPIGSILLLAAAIAVAAQRTGWEANPGVIEKETARLKGFNYEEARVDALPLPPVLGSDGVVRDPAAWAGRRAEILDLFRTHVFGRSPGKPDRLEFQVVEHADAAMNGAATLERVMVLSTYRSRVHQFELTVFLPNAPRTRVPLFLLLNNRPATNTDPSRREKSGFWPAEAMVARGYGIAALQVGDLAPDDKARFRDGVIGMFEGPGAGPRPGDAWGALAAWAWGASRAMDYFETHARIDPAKVAVVGHSRGGKAALWAGAEDGRFAMVVSNESGEGGAALSRRNFGETLARITEVFPHWFAMNYLTFAGRVADLPVDQHMLLSLAAPRALYVASADEDLWSDPRGEFLALAESSPVFALWGDRPIAGEAMPPLEQPLVSGRRGYHIRKGAHNLTPYDWERFADFADTLWH